MRAERPPSGGAGTEPTPSGGAGAERPPSGGAGTGRSDGPEASCELCEAARFTTWFYEDELCFALECESCGVPMVVWRQHGSDPPAAERARMLEVLASVAEAVLGKDAYRLDTVMRQIPGHFHAHARPRMGPGPGR
jgi:hypothetical protein